MDTIMFSDSTEALLLKLAAERAMTPSQLLEALITSYDNERHLVWSATQRKHMRVKCSSVYCFEDLERKEAGEIRD